MESGFSMVAGLIVPFPFSSVTRETHWRTTCASLPELSLWKRTSCNLLRSPSKTRLCFDFTSCIWFAEMGCWGFPSVHDLKLLFPHFDCQFYIWSKSCLLPGFLGKQFAKAAAFCPSALPVWVFDCTP